MCVWMPRKARGKAILSSRLSSSSTQQHPTTSSLVWCIYSWSYLNFFVLPGIHSFIFFSFFMHAYFIKQYIQVISLVSFLFSFFFFIIYLGCSIFLVWQRLITFLAPTWCSAVGLMKSLNRDAFCSKEFRAWKFVWQTKNTAW